MRTVLTLTFILLSHMCEAQQIADADFQPKVADPVHRSGSGPTIGIDETHGNFHTISGRYKPFAELLRRDGYVVVRFKRSFDRDSLSKLDILVIANAEGKTATDSAFTPAECEAVATWVSNGGALLLIADHAPFGAASAQLGLEFGVEMGKGWVFEPSEKTLSTQLVFSRDNDLLGRHVILTGRKPAERVQIVRTFTGQSLSIPRNADVLLKLPAHAREALNTDDVQAEASALAAGGASAARSVSVGGRAQGVAFIHGKGRVVVLGEAAMLSAQVATLVRDGAQIQVRMGMNVPGYDNQQFALNIARWLSGALP